MSRGLKLAGVHRPSQPVSRQDEALIRAFGRRVRELRLAKGLSQERLGFDAECA